MSTVLDSKFDLRREWDREELEELISKILSKTSPQTTRQISSKVGCNIEQAKLILDHLWIEGQAVYEGQTRNRVWFKAP